MDDHISGSGEILNQLKKNCKKSFYFVGYGMPLCIVMFPVFFLIGIIYSFYFVYFWMILSFVIIGIGLFFDFKMKRLTYKCWYPLSIFKQSFNIFYYIIFSAIIGYIFLMGGIWVLGWFDFGILLRTFPNVVILLFVAFIFKYILKKKMQSFTDSFQKHFKQKREKLIQLVKKELDYLKIGYAFEPKKLTFFTPPKDKFIITQHNFGIEIFQYGINRFTINFSSVNDKNRKTVQKIQEQIDIGQNLIT